MASSAARSHGRTAPSPATRHRLPGAALTSVHIVYYILHMCFGQYIRDRREERLLTNRCYSLRQVAERVGIEPAYLSKIERKQFAPPGEEVIRSLARELGEDADVLLAMAGKVSSDLQGIIRQRPKLFAELIRQLKDMPDHAVVRVVREVRDGEW